jgi:hypothetical protein
MFNGIWLVAAEPLTIQGRSIQTGERFHISRVHSGALLVTGRATIAHPQPPPKSRMADPPIAVPRKRGRPRKVVTPEPETVPNPIHDADQIGAITDRIYQRRDLEPE